MHWELIPIIVITLLFLILVIDAIRKHVKTVRRLEGVRKETILLEATAKVLQSVEWDKTHQTYVFRYAEIAHYVDRFRSEMDTGRESDIRLYKGLEKIWDAAQRAEVLNLPIDADHITLVQNEIRMEWISRAFNTTKDRSWTEYGI